MKYKNVVVAGLLLALALLSGCASVPMASPEKDAAAKALKVAPGKSVIYVYRNESFGAAVKMDVDLDGRRMGATVADTYLFAEVEPGMHKIGSHAENDVYLDVNAEAGKAYFVWQEVKMGLMYARSRLQLVDETEGRNAIQECKLIE